MAVANLAATGVLFTDRRDFYIAPNMYSELWTDVAPFTTILTGREVIKTKDPDFKMFEHRANWREQYFDINDSGDDIVWNNSGAHGNTTSGTVVIDGITGLYSTVDDSYLNQQIEIWDSTLETYKGVAVITARTSTELQFTGIGNAETSDESMTALADNDRCYVIGSAYGEGTVAGTAWHDDLETAWNSSQIFKTPIEITGTLYANTALRGYSNELARFRNDKGKIHKIQKEHAFMRGHRVGGIGSQFNANTNDEFLTTNHISDANSNIIRTTMGILPAMLRYGDSTDTSDTQNYFKRTKRGYNYAQFTEDMEKKFQYIPNKGYYRAFCSMNMLSYWNQMDARKGFVGESGWSVQLSDLKRDKLGFNFKILETPAGYLQLVYAPILDRGPWKNYMVIIDDDNLRLVQYRPGKFQVNIKTEDAYDGEKDQYFDDQGVKIILPETHALLKLS
jgi:hypothetical protein|tara:strand:+ start:10210 stop:11559 length:1350 start_codon:yes stop_codon:yes gene_type:complete